MCDTRWVERHESIARFTEMYVPVVHALEELENSPRHETAKIAHQLLCVITQGSFVLALNTADKFFSHTLPLCNTLQKVDCDLAECCSFVGQVLEVFGDIRANAESEFDTIFQKSQQMISAVGGDAITMPRTAGRQTARDNVPAVDSAEYYRRSLFLPFVDFLMAELNQRFTLHRKVMSALQNILPVHCSDIKPEQVAECVDFYKDILPDPEHLSSEMTVWQKKWQSVNGDRPSSAMDAFLACNTDFFPNIKILLRVLATLPVSTATAERSFSTMKRVKSFLRNCTGDNRLSGLALLSIHRNIPVNPTEVLDRFAKTPRRTKLLL